MRRRRISSAANSVDNLTHTLMGAALGKAGLARKSRMGMATLMIASNFPDIDVGVFATPVLAMSFRRGWTHGVLAQAVLPVVLAMVMRAWDRRVVQRRSNPPPRAQLSALILLSYIGVIGHVLMDYLNSYGVRLLMPFSQRWFYGDALYIVDPWIYLFLVGGLWFSRRRLKPSPSKETVEGRGFSPGLPTEPSPSNPSLESPSNPPMEGEGFSPRRPAQIAVGFVIAYMVAMWGSNLAARATVAADLVRAGQPGVRFMVTPVIVNPFRREVVIDLGDRYEKGNLWFDPLPHFRPGGYGIDTHLRDPEVQEALNRPRSRAFLGWSRFPFVMVDQAKSPPAVWLNDYRYANNGLAGWSATYVPVVQ